ncbi:MAG TPA: spore coat protein CotJB [Lachnospiraceae bacterium]|jgi:spore coat protein JB|nr:spore coat protein CotJB [Lachnospiraceae bacterium]
MNNMCNREALYRGIQSASFVMDDLRLYLDTHPTDQAALEHFEAYKNIRKNAIKEYTQLYGPIVAYDVDADNVWTWICEPWPWEGEC